MGKDGGQWEVEDDEKGRQNGRGKREMRWQVVEDKEGGGDGDEGRRGEMRRQWEMDEDDRRDGGTFSR